MRQVMVRYRVKADRAGENEQFVRAVFAQLDREKPPGLRYATFKLADGVSFIHLASIEATPNPLLALSAFKEFSAHIADRCDEPPVTVELSQVGTYRDAV